MDHAAVREKEKTEAALNDETLAAVAGLQQAMRRVPRGRAHGPDGIPGELLHHQPAVLAKLMYPQLVKMILHGHGFLA